MIQLVLKQLSQLGWFWILKECMVHKFEGVKWYAVLREECEEEICGIVEHRSGEEAASGGD